MLCSCLPGGFAVISIPQLSGSFSSSNDRSARPPPNSSVNMSRKFVRTCAKVSLNNFRVVELIVLVDCVEIYRTHVVQLCPKVCDEFVKVSISDVDRFLRAW